MALSRKSLRRERGIGCGHGDSGIQKASDADGRGFEPPHSEGSLVASQGSLGLCPVTVTVQETASCEAGLTVTGSRRRSQFLESKKRKLAGCSEMTRLSVQEAEQLYQQRHPGPNDEIMKIRLGALEKEIVGAKRHRWQLLKRAKARKRAAKHTWRLRATLGEETVLETISTSVWVLQDYRRRLTCFWDFADRFSLSLHVDRDYDNVAADWSDLEYLSGETPGAGRNFWPLWKSGHWPFGPQECYSSQGPGRS